ncbi:DNA cytosine methyltransferase [Microbacterium sp. LRZ72]|uniref:DNA cytosine methyltransferase n=1 Tax=Microbacterium sp. LRZ72 TaxID=2942481 RepID=UPI0029ABA5E4|nr:DNA cytosine methyltransferase [Microbacterium sp. LRZ72]MDX2375196.1 DNA cytosine methyltransferase [Microbacterium sp. LRZ72]
MPPTTPTDHVLRTRSKPPTDPDAAPVRIVDLFAGCGGLTLGAEQAVQASAMRLEIALAVDIEPLATAVYRRNFPDAEQVQTDSVESFFDGELGAHATFTEQLTQINTGRVDVLLGGPPCQGHSNLNNHTRRIDEKNALYLRVVRAAEILLPRVVLIENVPAVRNDRHSGEGVVERAKKHLAALGYRVDDRIIDLDTLGVAQRRRRHILLALADGEPITPDQIFDAAPTRVRRDLRWAIGDLLDATGDDPMDRAPQANDANRKRMQYLLDNDEYDLPNVLRPQCHQGNHSYKSMYGRLRWNEPAQTITSGFGSIGQGRYMHPQQARALTAHEAARIQGFPDYFDFSSCPTRHALATMIGNAVPPALTAALFNVLLAQANPSAHVATARARVSA